MDKPIPWKDVGPYISGRNPEAGKAWDTLMAPYLDDPDQPEQEVTFYPTGGIGVRNTPSAHDPQYEELWDPADRTWKYQESLTQDEVDRIWGDDTED